MKIAIPGIGADYDGKFETDGNSITGTLTRGTNPIPLPLKRDDLPDLFTAFQEQLGLKLEATKAPADVFVIEKVSKPSKN